MFLVVAVAMAALLIALAVILNAALFAGNLAAHDDGVDEAGALAYRSGVVDGVALTVTHANRNNNTNYGELRSTTKPRVETWSALAGRHAAASASGATVSIELTSNGTLVDQIDGSTFTNDGGAANWELVPATSNVRGFRLNVTRSALVTPVSDATASDLVTAGVFAVALDDGTSRWRVFVYQNGTTGVLLKVEDSSGGLSAACQAKAVDGRVLVDISNATVGDDVDCPQLDVLKVPASSFDVEFERGTSAAGTYQLFTEQKYGSVADGDFGGTDTGPRVSYALYSATVKLTYATPTLRYQTAVEVVPGATR